MSSANNIGGLVSSAVLQSARYVGKSITKSFDGALVLSQVDITFEPGRSTLCAGRMGQASHAAQDHGRRLPARLRRAPVRREQAGRANPEDRPAARIYMVPQEPSLMAALSITENLFLGIFGGAGCASTRTGRP